MYLAIDIGSQWIHILEVNPQGKTYTIHNKLLIEVPYGAFTEDGKLREVEVGELLGETLQKHQIKSKKIHITLQSEHYITKEFNVPKVKPKQLDQVLRQELALLVESNENYIMLYDAPIEEEGHWRVMVRALPAQLVEGCYKISQLANRQLKSLNTHDYYMKECLKQMKASTNFLIADIGSQNMQLYLIEKGENVFSQNVAINTRQQEMTFASLNEMQGINQEFKDVVLSEEGFNVHTILEGALTNYLNDLVSQMHYMLQFQLGRDAENPIETIYLCGGVSQMKGLATYLENELEVQTQLLSQVLDLESIFKEETSSYVNALNVAHFPGKRHGGFMVAYQKQKKVNQQVSQVSAIGGGLLGIQCIILATLGTNTAVRYIGLQSEVKQAGVLIEDQGIQEQILALKKLQEKNRDYESHIGKLALAKEALGQDAFVDEAFLREITKKMPLDMTIQSLSYMQGQLELNSQCTYETSIIQYIQYIRSVSGVAQVSYRGFNYKEGKYQFNVTIELEGGGLDEAQS